MSSLLALSAARLKPTASSATASGPTVSMTVKLCRCYQHRDQLRRHYQRHRFLRRDQLYHFAPSAK